MWFWGCDIWNIWYDVCSGGGIWCSGAGIWLDVCSGGGIWCSGADTWFCWWFGYNVFSFWVRLMWLSCDFTRWFLHVICFCSRRHLTRKGHSDHFSCHEQALSSPLIPLLILPLKHKGTNNNTYTNYSPFMHSFQQQKLID